MGLGKTNCFGWGYEPKHDDLLLEKTFKEAVAGDLSLVDTADSYGNGVNNERSEFLLGCFLANLSKKQLNRLMIATKLAPYPWRLGRKGFVRAFNSSQKRLQDNLNRMQLHWSTSSSRYAPW